MKHNSNVVNFPHTHARREEDYNHHPVLVFIFRVILIALVAMLVALAGCTAPDIQRTRLPNGVIQLRTLESSHDNGLAYRANDTLAVKASQECPNGYSKTVDIIPGFLNVVTWQVKCVK